MKNPEQTKYGRCEGTAKSTGRRCGRAAIGEHGKCDVHGGKSKRGEDAPAFEHGLFSDHLPEEEQDTIDALGEFDDVGKLDDLINWRLARLRRAVKALNDQENNRTFWDAFREVVEKTDAIEASEIRELAKMLDKGSRSVQLEVDLVRKLIKDRNKIAEGETRNLEMGDEWRELMSGDKK